MPSNSSLTILLFAALSPAWPAAAQTASTTPRAAAYTETAAGNLPAQKIGPNDLISISVYDSPEFTRQVRVAADGTIILPMMRHAIPAAGLMPRELEDRIAQALISERLLKEPSVIVTVAEYVRRPVIVTGAVRSPVTIQALGDLTLMDAITRAGGIAPEAGPEILVDSALSSDPALIRRIPIKPLLNASDPKLNITLNPGDEVRVPAAGRISVLGNVKNTGSFPILDTTDTTVLNALVLAGGFATTKPNEAYIIRQDDTPQGRHQIPVPIRDIVDRKAPDVPLIAHDILFVPTNKKHETLLALAQILGVAGSSAILINVLK